MKRPKKLNPWNQRIRLTDPFENSIPLYNIFPTPAMFTGWLVR